MGKSTTLGDAWVPVQVDMSLHDVALIHQVEVVTESDTEFGIQCTCGALWYRQKT